MPLRSRFFVVSAGCFSLLLLLVRLDRLTHRAPASNRMLSMGASAWANNRTHWLLEVADELKCPQILNETATAAERAFARTLEYSEEFFFDRFDSGMDRCTNLGRVFDFDLSPPLDEKAEFPLGFGMIVYKNLAQFYLAFSAFYRPHNAHCIVVDSKSGEDFRRGVREAADCFPNVTVIEMGPIEWCTRTVMEAQFACFERLVRSAHPWRYYQYVTGFDVPLRTNMETIQMLRELNDSVVFEHLRGMHFPVDGIWDPPTGMRIFSTSMAAVVSRRAANDAILPPAHFKKTRRLFDRILNGRDVGESRDLFYRACKDELLFGTLFGNKREFPIFGSHDAAALTRANITEWTFRNASLHRARLARFQIWKQEECKGRFRRYSCAYGLGDLPQIRAAHELFAHKFHADFDWAAFLCLRAEIKRPNRPSRSPPPLRLLPQVRLQNGETIEEIFGPKK